MGEYLGPFPFQIKWEIVSHSNPDVILASGKPSTANGVSIEDVLINSDLDCLEFRIINYSSEGNLGEQYYKLIDAETNTVLADIHEPFGFLDARSLQITNIVSSVPLEKIEKISVFPNPASDNINIQLNGQNVSNILLYNALGEIVVLENNINYNNDLILLHTNQLLNGLYFLEIRSGGTRVIKKIIIANRL